MAEIKIAPSILAADFGRLGEEVRAAEEGGADYIHVDVMDGRFVPNITMGPLIVEAVRRSTTLPLDVHLMILEPERHVDAIVEAGADIVTFHPEATPHQHRVIQQIHGRGARAGVVLNPGTPVSAIEAVLGDVDLVLVMSVNPGWGGQGFIDSALEKLRAVRGLLNRIGSAAELEVDGGIKEDTAAAAVTAGAGVLVSGTGVYNKQRSVAESISRLRAATRV